MTPFHAVLLVVLSVQDPQLRTDCRPWQECRQLALDAVSRQEYETFHDLAWRAVQTGPKNDPDLMYLLARAQSLSGRPGDALVMLQRLARMGVPTDAASSEDFRRVRALPAWPETEALLNNVGRVEARSAAGDRAGAAAMIDPPRVAAAPKADKAAAAVGGLPSAPAPTSRSKAEPEPVPKPEPAARRADVSDPAAAGASETAARTSTAGAAPAESLRFTTLPFTPAGLAYDAVSRRFIVGDRDARKLAVVDEFSHHVANLASARSSGFGDIAALEIDVRQGNLWVVSNEAPSEADEAGSSPRTDRTGKATLHKLQLVSGRLLASYTLPERLGRARFVDVATTSNGTVIVLDAEGHRLLRLAPKAGALEVAAPIPDLPATSLAPAQPDFLYVANKDGIVAVNLTSRRSTLVKAAKGVDIGGIARLRWHNGSLIAVQQNGSAYRAIRLALGRNGRTAAALQVLDESLSTTDPTAATVSGGWLYYLASGEGAEMIVRKVTLN